MLTEIRKNVVPCSRCRSVVAGLMEKYKELYTNIYPVENAKSRDGIQWEGRCPFHDDRNNSFGYKLDTGVCNCFVGCIKGGAYDYAVKRGMLEKDARIYFNGHDANFTKTPPPPWGEPTPETL